MKLYLGTPGWGWRMWGLVGKNSRWFFGFSQAAPIDAWEPAFPALAVVRSWRQALEVTPAKSCAWGDDEHGIWATDCGYSYVFEAGKPTDNGMKFCCFCSLPIEQVDYMEEVEDET